MTPGLSSPEPEDGRYRAFYSQPEPVEFDVVLPDDIDGEADLRQFLLDEAPFSREAAVRVEPAFPPDGVTPGATNPSDPGSGATEGAEGLRNDLGADPIRTLARVLDPVAYDPRAVPTNVGQGWDRKRRQMVAEVHATAALADGYRRVVEDDDTIGRLAAELIRWVDGLGKRARWTADDAARAVVRALREET